MIEILSGKPNRSEREVFAALASHRGLLLGCIRINQERRTRELDAVLLLPTGAFVVEVKGTAASGAVHAPGNWPWSVGGKADAFKGTKTNPGQQAEEAAKMLASVLRGRDVPVPFVRPWVVLDGQRLELEGGMASEWNGVVDVTTTDNLKRGRAKIVGKDRVGVQTVAQILEALEVPQGERPTDEELIGEGFSPVAAPASRSRPAASARRPAATPRPAGPQTRRTPPRAAPPRDASGTGRANQTRSAAANHQQDPTGSRAFWERGFRIALVAFFVLLLIGAIAALGEGAEWLGRRIGQM